MPCASAPPPRRPRFFVLVPNPDNLPFDRNGADTADGEKPCGKVLPLLQQQSGAEVEGRVASSPNAYDDIVAALDSGEYAGDHPGDAAQSLLALAAHRPAAADRPPRLPADDGDGDCLRGAAIEGK